MSQTKPYLMKRQVPEARAHHFVGNILKALLLGLLGREDLSQRGFKSLLLHVRNPCSGRGKGQHLVDHLFGGSRVIRIPILSAKLATVIGDLVRFLISRLLSWKYPIRGNFRVIFWIWSQTTPTSKSDASRGMIYESESAADFPSCFECFCPNL
jgi:hypothetical protein